MDSAPIPLSAFLSTSCFRCFNPSPSSPLPSSAPPTAAPPALKRCSGCKRVRYCSSACAAEDWKDHKPLCKALAAIRSTLKPFPPLPANASEPEIARRREGHFKRWAEEDDLLQAALKRQATPTEGQLLWRERRCGVCWARESVGGEVREGEREGWRSCEGEGGCGGVVGWCSEVCEGRGREVHLRKGDEGAWEGRSECEIVHLAEQIDRFLLAEHLSTASALTTTTKDASPSPPAKPPQPVYIPPRLLSTPSSLPSSWSDYLSSLPPFPPSFQPTEAQLYGHLLPPLAPALTVISSLHRLFPSEASTATSLTLLLLDSTPETVKRETLALEEVFHLLPALKRIRIITVAPQDAAVSAPLVNKDGQPIPGQGEVKVAELPLCGGCKARGRQRTIEHFQTLDDPSFSLSPSPSRVESLEDGEERERHLTLALAWDTSLALCIPPSLSSSPSSLTPTDLFWSQSVFQPLSSLTASSPPAPVGLVLTAQTKDDLSSSLLFARSCLSLPTLSPPSSSSSAAGWNEERNTWRDPRPRVEGWWDHRLPSGKGEGERDEDGGVSWAGGWWAALKLSGGGGAEGEKVKNEMRGEEKVGR